MSLQPVSIEALRPSPKAPLLSNQDSPEAAANGVVSVDSWDEDLVFLPNNSPLSPVVRSRLVVSVLEAEELLQKKRRRDGLDLALRAIDSALHAGRFNEVNDLLQVVAWDRIDIDLAVTVLMTSKPASKRIPARRRAVALFGARIARDMPERAPKIRSVL